MGSVAVVELHDVPARLLAERSAAWSRSGVGATLVLGTPADEAIVLGAFQRGSEVASDAPMFRRGSGGAAALVGPGTLWMQLHLPRPDFLVACRADQLLNRYVRPLLRGLTRATGVPAAYFGRDWVSAAHHPVALLAFAHDTTTGACLVEAIIAVSRGFTEHPRASFRGRPPATLAALAARPLQLRDMARAIGQEYATLAGGGGVGGEAGVGDEAGVGAEGEAGVGDEAGVGFEGGVEAGVGFEVAAAGGVGVAAGVEVEVGVEAGGEVAGAGEGAWAATGQEAMGTLGAGRDASGRMRVGGELMASRDAIVRLEDALAMLPADATADDIGKVVDATLGSAVVFGVRSLASIRDLIVAAR